VFRILVGRGIYHDIIEPEILAGTHDPDGDLASVGNEYFVLHDDRAALFRVGNYN
jgi:hypothetical protein